MSEVVLRILAIFCILFEGHPLCRDDCFSGGQRELGHTADSATQNAVSIVEKVKGGLVGEWCRSAAVSLF